MTRPPKHIVRALLTAAGQQITMSEVELLEDNEGRPLAVHIEPKTGYMTKARPEHFGYTQEELDDDND